MALRSVSMHGVLFVVASVLAFRSWTAEEAPSEKHVGAELWTGRPKDISKVEFSTKRKHLLLEPQTDKEGGYYIATVQTLTAPTDENEAKPSAASPHSPRVNPHMAGAGGAPLTPPAVDAAKSAAPVVPRAPKRFVSVERGEKLVSALASLRATRVLGKVEGERLAEFGFDDNKGLLNVLVGGQEHQLIFGDKTPGGKDRYVREPGSGLAYVIAGSVANDLTTSENRLVERNFHAFGDQGVAQIKISTEGAGRDVRRHPTEKNFWASVEDPDTKDETLSNWMTKLERLRVTHYVESPAPSPTPGDQVVRVEYADDKGRPLGFLEVVRLPPEEGKSKTRYLARSERSRWYATVLRSTAEQLDQDLASILAK